MRRNQHKIREHERLLVEGVDADMNKVPEMGGLDVSAAAWIGAVVSSVTAAAGTNMGVTAAATTVGVASTGARSPAFLVLRRRARCWRFLAAAVWQQAVVE